MAKKDDEEIVDVGDADEVVTVDVDEASPPASTEKTPPPAKKPVERVRLPDDEPPAAASSVEEAATQMAAQLKAAEEAKRAAEATAAAERREREAAQRELARSQEDARNAQAQAFSHELNNVTVGIESAKRELAAAQAELTRLYESGEFAKAAETQVAIGRATAALDRLETNKTALEAMGQQRPTTTGRVVESEPTTNPFERYVSQYAPAAQAWLRTHPDCVPPEVGGNASKNAQMMQGHWAAMAKGFAPNSPEYFQTIDGYVLGEGGAEPAAAAAPSALSSAARPRPAAAPVAAPPSREPPSPSTGIPRSTRQVTLSKEQQEIAKLSFPSDDPKVAFAKYAKNLLELDAEGKLGRTTH